MKKIKEYINNKPRLKKTLRILAVIGVIFSVGFNILIIGVGSCSIHSQKNDSIEEPLATTPIVKSAYNKNGSTFIGLSELVSYDYFVRFVDNLKEYEFVYNTGVSVENFLLGTSVNITTPNMWIVDLDTDGSIVNTSTIQTINLDIDYVSDYCTRFRFTFAFANQYSVCLEGYYYFNDIAHNEYLFNTFIYETSQPQLLYWDRSCLSFAIGTYTSLFPSGTSGTNYQIGYNMGYQYGYRQGYDVGALVSNSDNFTPISLIKDAFRAIADILNIQVLPGITLSVIIFTPVIITMIIVIVKMFKG